MNLQQSEMQSPKKFRIKRKNNNKTRKCETFLATGFHLTALYCSIKKFFFFNSELVAPEPEHCPGTGSEDAGQASACEGCPNQKICASSTPAVS